MLECALKANEVISETDNKIHNWLLVYLGAEE